jgi:hypothetical protein
MANSNKTIKPQKPMTAKNSVENFSKVHKGIRKFEVMSSYPPPKTKKK